MSWWRRVDLLAVIIIPCYLVLFVMVLILSQAHSAWLTTVFLGVGMLYILLPHKKRYYSLTVVNDCIYYPGESRRYFMWLWDEVSNLDRELSAISVHTLLHCNDGGHYVSVYPGLCMIRAENLENRPRQIDVESFKKKVNEHLSSIMTKFSEGKSLAEAMRFISNDNYEVTIDGLALEWSGDTRFEFTLAIEEES